MAPRFRPKDSLAKSAAIIQRGCVTTLHGSFAMISIKMISTFVFCIAFGATIGLAVLAAPAEKPTKTIMSLKGKPRNTRKSFEACDATYNRLKEEEDAISSSYLQQCFYDEACNQQDRCDWYQSIVDYSSRMEQIASRCERLPNSDAEASRAHNGVESNQALLDQKCTGELGAEGQSKTLADIKLRRERYKNRIAVKISKGGIRVVTAHAGSRPAGRFGNSVPTARHK